MEEAYRHVSQSFVGREHELRSFAELGQQTGAKILVVYGRRRIGKTTLIHKAFASRSLLKFEGLENRPPAVQRQHVLEQLAVFANNPSLAKLRLKTWREVLIEISKITASGRWTIYFEEVQWIASYKEDLIVDLKFVWDNYLVNNPDLILILCGSSPSFLIDKVMMSRALYNRSQYEFPISELSFSESSLLIGRNRSLEEVLDAYLAVGGIPEYLQRLTTHSSIYLSLCEQSFKTGGFFVDEASRIFVSSLAKNRRYLATIEFLAAVRAATKGEILQALKLTSGGTTSNIFADLQKCGFVGTYNILEVGAVGRDVKYYLKDNYLHFYYRFIKPNLSEIRNSSFIGNPTYPLDYKAYRQWLGYALERFCLRFGFALARLLGFEAVKFGYGPYYKRGGGDAGAQIDLMYKRADGVYTVCEIKYQLSPPGKEVIEQCDRKITALLPAKASIQRILISPNGADNYVKNSGYFDKIIEAKHLLELDRTPPLMR